MKPPRRKSPSTDDEPTAIPFGSAGRRAWHRFRAFRLRDLWWRLLDRWESSRRFRLGLIGLLGSLLLVAVVVLWIYPWWTRRNSVKLAREWLAAGRINYAVEAVQQAIQLDPKNPEPWQIAAEIARRRGQPERAAEYAQHAATLAPENPLLQISWAAQALRADLAKDAATALARVPADALAASPDAQRILGELARRNQQLDEAQARFEAALRLDGSVAVDEVPLGLILLNARDPAERARGLAFLSKWAGDHEWGAAAARTLLTDATGRNDLPAMAQWADALRTHPNCTVSDMPNCLLALSRANPVQFNQVLADLERNHAVSPTAATQLLSWLNQIGRSAEALQWSRTLPAADMQRPPLAVAAAEALRLTEDWRGLQNWVGTQDWGTDADFLRWAYGLQAAQRLGNDAEAGDLWRTLDGHAQLNSVHALFAGSTIFAWGLTKDAEALWWRAAAHEGKVALDALGTLARFYQSQRDAEGQYRVFRQLHLLQPQDATIGNNFSFFAALTGREQRLAEQVARGNLAADPRNSTYAATASFGLTMQNRAAEALTLIKPFAAEAGRSPAMAFAYGLALAGTQQKAAARSLLKSIPPETLTRREEEIIAAALKD